jgi:hypothetical protein
MILIYKILEKLHNQYARLRGIDDFHIRPEDIHVNSEQAKESKPKSNPSVELGITINK